MSTVKEIQAELDELGVEYPSDAKKPELEKLLADKKPEETEEEVETEEETETETETEEEVETEDASIDATKVGVYRGEALMRAFNNVTHGDDFKKIAAAYAKKNGGVVKDYVDPSAPVVEKESVKIVNKNGNLVRTFALSTHGKGYEELAESYLEKHGEAKGLKRG